MSNKTNVVRARIETSVKKDAEGILKRLGVTHSTFINMSYRAVVENVGIPFPVSIPNKETQKAVLEGRSRKGTGTRSAAAWRKSLKSI